MRDIPFVFSTGYDVSFSKVGFSDGH